MLVLWMIFLFGTAVCEHIIRMKTGETVEIINDNYPETSNNFKDSWKLGTSRGGAIKLECDDIRINGKTCEEGKLLISAGDVPQTICDTRKNYAVTSLFESLYIDIDFKTSHGAFRCKATALSSPEPLEKHQKTIHVKLGTTNIEINHSKLERMKLYEYDITTEPGSYLVAKCSLFNKNSPAKNICEELTVTFKSVEGTQKYCETNSKIQFYANDDLMKIDLKTGLLLGYGYFYCDIKSVIAGTYSNYKQIASEEVDSSEYGLVTKKSDKTTTCNCGWSNKDNRRIIYGHDASVHEYPWSVSLQTLDGFHFCGGSIISEYHILTAAHCLRHFMPEDIQVVMGTNNRSNSEYAIRVKEKIAHNYEQETVQRDIAILVLEKKIEFNSFIGPICLLSKELNIDHQHVTAMGWGRLAESEYKTKNPDLLKKTKLRIVDIYSCTLDWNLKWNLESPNLICTWSNHTDICLGDSGGPVVWLNPETNRYYLVGMPALCDNCTLTLPSVHTSVYHFYDWIQTKIAESKEPAGKTCTTAD